MPLNKIYSITVLIISLIFQNIKLFSQNRIDFNRIDSLISARTEKPFNGNILISQNGVTQYSKTIGFSDYESKLPLTINSQFVIGSISKQFTAVLTLQEYDKGTITLNTPIKKYLLELKQKWADTVTVHHLLTHLHGITLLDKPTSFPVGSQYSYSQIGYDLLAKIIEKVSGESFAAKSNKLFKKCSMKYTFHPDSKKHKI